MRCPPHAPWRHQSCATPLSEEGGILFIQYLLIKHKLAVSVKLILACGKQSVGHRFAECISTILNCLEAGVDVIVITLGVCYKTRTGCSSVYVVTNISVAIEYKSGLCAELFAAQIAGKIAVLSNMSAESLDNFSLGSRTVADPLPLRTAWRF